LAKDKDIVDRTLQFATRLLGLVNKFNNNASARVISSQIVRSGTSIGANVEEAQAAESRADFIHKYGLDLKEARETRYWLKLVGASDMMPRKDLVSLTKESDETCRIIAQIIINARKK